MLAHGLFTYTLLMGAGAIASRDEPKQVSALKLPPNADFDKDGVLSTAELDAYVKQALPEMAALFPSIAVASRDAVPARGGTQALDQAPRVQSADASFPLAPLADPRP